jgi:hypothetical protein
MGSEHLLLDYTGDTVAPDAKTDATLHFGVEEAARARVKPNFEEFDALDDWKGEGSEKKEQKSDEE